MQIPSRIVGADPACPEPAAVRAEPAEGSKYERQRSYTAVPAMPQHTLFDKLRACPVLVSGSNVVTADSTTVDWLLADCMPT